MAVEPSLWDSLPCGCKATACDTGWRIEAEAFLCSQRHKQGDEIQDFIDDPPGPEVRSLPSYMLAPVIHSAVRVANAGNLIDSCDETEQVDRFALASLRAALVGIGYARKDVEGR